MAEPPRKETLNMVKTVLFAIPQLTGGGAERVVSVWANELNARGYKVSILLFRRAENEYYTSDSIRIAALAPTVEEYKALSFPKRFAKMRSVLKSEKPDYIISFLPAMQVWMMFTAIGLKTRRIETIRINPWRSSILNSPMKFLWLLAFHTGHKIIVQARDQIPFFSKRDQKKCVLIPNPISELYVENHKEAFDDEVTTFITAGRLSPQKNFPMVIEAFARIAGENPALKLKIFGAGDDAYTSLLKKKISDEGMENNVFLMGRTPHMEEEYKNADAFILGSDFEGLPNVLMEAMASRLVCISTDCKTGPADLVDDGVNGYLIPVGDTDALTEKIRAIVSMPKEERIAMADAARNKILTYCSQKNSVEKLCNLLK